MTIVVFLLCIGAVSAENADSGTAETMDNGYIASAPSVESNVQISNVENDVQVNDVKSDDTSHQAKNIEKTNESTLKQADDDDSERYRAVLSWNRVNWDPSGTPYTYKNPWLMNDSVWAYELGIYSASKYSNPLNPHGYYSSSYLSRNAPAGIYKRTELTDDMEFINTGTGENVLPYIRTFLYNHYNDSQNFTNQSNFYTCDLSLVINAFVDSSYDYRVSTTYRNTRTVKNVPVWTYVSETLDLVNNGQGVPNSGQFKDSDFLTYKFYMYEYDPELNLEGKTYYSLIGFQLFTNVNIEKQWEDTDAEIRPDNVTVMINANGANVKNLTLTAADDWKTVATDLPVYEVANSDRVLEMDTDYTVTTTTEDVIDLKITFTPDDPNYSATVYYNLYANGEPVWYSSTMQYWTLTKANGYTTVLNHGTKYDENGNLIEYTVKEVNSSNYVPLDDDLKHGDITAEIINGIDNEYYVKHFKVNVTNRELVPPSGNANLRVYAGDTYWATSISSSNWNNGWVINVDNRPSSMTEEDLVVVYNYPSVNTINYTVDEVIYDYNKQIDETYESVNPTMTGRWYMNSTNMNPVLKNVSLTNTYFEKPINITDMNGLKYVIWENTTISNETYMVVGNWGEWYYVYYGGENPFLMNDTTWVYCIEHNARNPDGAKSNSVVPGIYRKITLTDNEKIIHPVTGEDILPYLRTVIYLYNTNGEFADWTDSYGKILLTGILNSFTDTDDGFGDPNNYRNPDTRHNAAPINGKTVGYYVQQILDIVDSGNGINNSGQYNNSDLLTYQFYLYVTDNQLNNEDYKYQNVLGFNIFTKIDVTKKWDDENDLASQRPKSIEVQLLGNNETIGESIILNRSNNWTYTFTELPVYYMYNFTQGISEEDVSTSTSDVKLENLTVKKVWNDDYTSTKPSSILCYIYKNGNRLGSFRLYRDENYITTLHYLEKYDEEGNEIEYTIQELGSYTSYGSIEITPSEEFTVYQLTYKLINDTLKMEGNTLVLLEDGHFVDYANGDDDWTISVLSESDDSSSLSVQLFSKPRVNIINYTIDEVNISDGYTSTVIKTTESINPLMPIVDYSQMEDIRYYVDEDLNDILTSETITNTFDFAIKKDWIDFDNKDGIRPESINVNIFANGEFLRTVELNESNNWTISIKDLPKYDEEDNPINYTVEELEIEGYTSEIYQRSNYFIITNKHIPKYLTLNVTKVWNDGENADNTRPIGINIDLLANGEVYDSIILSYLNNWTHNFTDLPEYIDGVKVNYTINETSVPTGYTVTYGDIVPVIVKKATNITLDLLNLTKDENNIPVSGKFKVVVTDQYGSRVTQGSVIVTDSQGQTIASGELSGGVLIIDDIPLIHDTTKPPLNITYDVNVKYEENDLYLESSETFNNLDTHYVNTVVETRTLTLEFIRLEDVTETSANAVYKVTITDKEGQLCNNSRIIWRSTTSGHVSSGYSLAELEDGSTELSIPAIITDSSAENPEFMLNVTMYINDELIEQYSFSRLMSFMGLEGSYYVLLSQASRTNWGGSSYWIKYSLRTQQMNAPGGIPSAPWNITDGTWGYCIDPSIPHGTTNGLFDPDYNNSIYVKVVMTDDTIANYRPYDVDGYTYKENAFDYIRTLILKYGDDFESFINRPISGQPTLQDLISVLTGVWTKDEELNVYRLEHYAGHAADIQCDFVYPSGYTFEHYVEEISNMIDQGLIAGNHGIKNYTEDGRWEYQFYIYYPSTYYTATNPRYQRMVGIEYYFIPNENIYATTSLTNTPLTKICVSKVWNDSNDQDAIRPDNITVLLKADGEEYNTTVLNESNNWTFTFENLPKYTMGDETHEIVYTITEVLDESIASNYTLSTSTCPCDDSTIILINTHIPELVNITVYKAWNDSDNQDGIRPENVTVNLYADGKLFDTVVINDTLNYTFVDLPKYNGSTVPINYTIEEVNLVTGYEATYNQTNLTVINTHIPEKVKLNVTKVWNDADNQDGLRPSSIVVKVYGVDKTTPVAELTLSADTWYNETDWLDKYSDGEVIEYTLVEELPENSENYTQELFYCNGTYKFVNTHIPEYLNLTVNKIWNDTDNHDGFRPDEVIIKLKQNGVEYRVGVLNSTNGWKYIFVDLPKFSNGEELVYDIEEVTVSEYYTTTIKREGNQINITNTHEPEFINLTVNKTWVDLNNLNGIRPNNVTVELLLNGEYYSEVMLNKTSSRTTNWTYTFKNLPKYKDGQLVNYTFNEVNVPNGYDVEYNYTSNGNKYNATVINTHIPENVSFVVQKFWDDNNNQDGLRSSITVVLTNGTNNRTFTLTSSNNWTARLNVSKYSNGNELDFSNYYILELRSFTYSANYTVSYGETVITNYIVNTTKSPYNVTEYSFTLTNTHIPQNVSINISKEWLYDADNKDNSRSKSVVVVLYANNNPIRTITLNDSNNWSYYEDNLPKFNGSRSKISYSVAELNPPSGYEYSIRSNTTTNNYTFVVRNLYVKNITVQKVWDDNDDCDKIRPDSISVILYRNGQHYQAWQVKGPSWTYTFNSLAVYDSEGNEIEYTVEEVTPQYYVGDITYDGNDVTITNTYVGQSMTITKFWNDTDNRDGIRPDSINVTVLANGNNYTQVTLTEDNNWTVVLSDLPKYIDGTLVEYTINETVPDGYVENHTQVIIEESKIPTEIHMELIGFDNLRTEDETVTFNIYVTDKMLNRLSTGTLVLRDGEGNIINSQDLSTNDTIVLTVPNAGEIVVNAYYEGNDQYLTSNQTIIDEDTLVYYAGQGVDPYRMTDGAYGYCINYSTPGPSEPISYDDNDNLVYMPYNKVVITDEVLINPRTGEDVLPYIRTYIFNHRFNLASPVVHLFLDDYGASQLHYDDPETYWREGSWITEPLVETIEQVQAGNIVPNHFIIEDEDGNKRAYQFYLYVPLYTLMQTRIYGYYWQELIGFVEVMLPETINYSVNITNTHEPETVNITVSKVWNDTDNRDGLRPTSINITIYADDNPYQTVKVNATEGNVWNYTFTDLPKYNRTDDVTHEIVYTVSEVLDESIAGNYTLTMGTCPCDDSTIILINTHIPELVNITVYKAWNDSDNQDGIRPENVTVNLYADGKLFDTVVINSTLKYTFLDLPKFNGSTTPIEYTIEEVGGKSCKWL